MHPLTRRDFMQIGAGSVVAGGAAQITLLAPVAPWGAGRAVGPSDRVRFAAIGTGTRGCELAQASLTVPGVECVAVCDLYDSRHEAAQEALQKQVPATRNYREILDRKDVDAVIVAVTAGRHGCARSIWRSGSRNIPSLRRSTTRPLRPRHLRRRKDTAMWRPTRLIFSTRFELARPPWRTRSLATMRRSDAILPTTLISRTRLRTGMGTRRKFGD